MSQAFCVGVPKLQPRNLKVKKLTIVPWIFSKKKRPKKNAELLQLFSPIPLLCQKGLQGYQHRPQVTRRSAFRWLHLTIVQTNSWNLKIMLSNSNLPSSRGSIFNNPLTRNKVSQGGIAYWPILMFHKIRKTKQKTSLGSVGTFSPLVFFFSHGTGHSFYT